MDLLPTGPSRDLDVEWRAVGLRCRLRPRSLPEPALDVLAEFAFLWLFGTSLALVGAIAIGLAFVIAFEPLEQPLALALAASVGMGATFAVRGLARWVRGKLFWEVELDGAALVAHHHLGPVRLRTVRWPLETVRATLSDDGLGVFTGQSRTVLRTDERPSDLRWLARAIHEARQNRARFWRQVLGRPQERQALMRLLARQPRGGGGWGLRNTH